MPGSEYRHSHDEGGNAHAVEAANGAGDVGPTYEDGREAKGDNAERQRGVREQGAGGGPRGGGVQVVSGQPWVPCRAPWSGMVSGSSLVRQGVLYQRGKSLFLNMLFRLKY